MNKLHIIIFLLVTSLFSCGMLNKSNLENNLLNTISLSDKELIEKINSKNISPDWVSLNSRVKINTEGLEMKINAQIRIKKDSVIWISVKNPLGIEVFRTTITPDSIYFMSRINKTYFIKHISKIKEVVKADFSFVQLQEILFASPKITALNSETENYEILKDIFRVYKIDLQEIKEKKVSIKYTDYKYFSELRGLHFPENFFVDIKSPEENFTAEINHIRIKFNKKGSISFIIPKSYVPIN